jgi:two-component system cell cycle response regulator CtrA
MRVLVVDQDQSIADGLGFVLREAGYLSDHAPTGEEGVSLSRLYEYDLIILDIMLPDMDGFEILHKLRSNGMKVPIMVVSHLKDVTKKIEALNLGADDYVTKPFHVNELFARAQAIVRRSQGHSASAIEVGRLKIDLRRNVAEVNGTIINLTNKEYAILELLAIRKGVVISKEMFLNHLYGGIDEPEIKIVDVFICRLRKKIAAVTEGDNFIQTVWGRGYILQDPMQQKVSKDILKVG